jgi:hypothetical protein
MNDRRQLLAGHAAVAFVVIVTAVMACAALGSVSARAESAQTDMLDDLRLVESVRNQVVELVDTTRRFLNDHDDDQRAWLGELQRLLEPYVDRLAARERTVEETASWRLENEAEAFFDWLARAVTDGTTSGSFDRALQIHGAALFTELQALEIAIEQHCEERLASARALGRRAQLGIIFTSTIAILAGGLLAWHLSSMLGRRH